jgi:hypothetical protein
MDYHSLNGRQWGAAREARAIGVNPSQVPFRGRRRVTVLGGAGIGVQPPMVRAQARGVNAKALGQKRIRQAKL